MKPCVVALTGTIGSGKSAAAEVFRSCGFEIIDADLLSREVVAAGSPGLQAVIQHFGAEFALPDGSLDRRRLGERIFTSDQDRRALEAILHPRIRALFLARLSALSAPNPPPAPLPPKCVLYVIPLLFESKFSYDEIDLIVVVSAPAEECVKRIIARDGCSEALARKKLASQLPIEQKTRQADFVFDNSGSLESLREQILAVIPEILKRCPKD